MFESIIELWAQICYNIGGVNKCASRSRCMHPMLAGGKCIRKVSDDVMTQDSASACYGSDF